MYFYRFNGTQLRRLSNIRKRLLHRKSCNDHVVLRHLSCIIVGLYQNVF